MDEMHLEPKETKELRQVAEEPVQPEPGVNTGINFDRPPEIAHGPTHVTKTQV